MPYVDRDPTGAVTALHREPTRPGHERLEVDHPDVVAFLGPGDDGMKATFAPLDADFVRVIEDVIDVLITRHVITITDLPAEAQTKLLRRKGVREGLGRSALRLFAPDDDRGVI